MLVLEGIHAGYGSIEALHSVSIRVERNEIVAIIGPNGAGKSSTLLTIAGVIKPWKGSISYEGKSLIGLLPEEIIRKGIALVPEGRHILSGLTVEENLRLGATIHRSNVSQVENDLKDMYSRFQILGERKKQQGTTLSGGEQQQLAIARGLMSRPKLLMLDEPSLGLAPQLVDGIFKLVSQLRESGATILLVEQNVERTLEIADRVYLLGKGKVIVEGSSQEVRERVDITGAYLGGKREPDREGD